MLLNFLALRCQCNEGMCGPECSLLDPCQETEPCMNGAICLEVCSTFSDYKCQCLDGYAGKNCSEVVSLSDKFLKNLIQIKKKSTGTPKIRHISW